MRDKPDDIEELLRRSLERLREERKGGELERVKRKLDLRKLDLNGRYLRKPVPMRQKPPPLVCDIPDCGEKRRGAGFCRAHYAEYLDFVAKGVE